ncbi:MAG: RNA polymerase sigma factor [Planctomycetota bacterium]
MTDGSDLELIAEANRGGEEAMTLLYERYREWVMAQALRVVPSEADALDVLQETFLYFFGKFPGFTLRCQLKTFLYPAIRHIALNQIRKRKRIRPIDGTEELIPAPPVRDAAAERDALSELIAGLSDAHRDVVLLRFDDGFSLEEIGERLGIALGTVKSRLHNALKQLEPRLKREYGEETGR